MANTWPFRFGVGASTAQSYQEWVGKARRAEELGYASLLMFDHLSVDFSPTVALMAAADATKTLRIGCTVFCNDFRHPTMLAKEAATLDVLSEGRLELGLGAGWQQSEYEQAGMAFDPAGVRISRFEESLTIIKGLLAEGPVTFSGKYYTVKDLKGTPTPVQQPHIPLYIGGGGKRVLSIAAREADIVGIVPISPTNTSWQNMSNGTAEATRQKVEWIRQAAGSRFDQLELNTTVFATVVTEYQSRVAERMSTNFGLTSEQVLDVTHILVGTVEQICETLLRRREEYGISYITVLYKDMETFAPIVARLAGQ